MYVLDTEMSLLLVGLMLGLHFTNNNNGTLQTITTTAQGTRDPTGADLANLKKGVFYEATLIIH